MTWLNDARQTWRSVPPLVFDAALALGLTIAMVVEAAGSSNVGPLGPAALLLTAPLAWRRRQPLIVFLLVVAGAMMTFPTAEGVGLVAAMIAAYSVGSYARFRLASLAVTLATATFVVAAFGGGLPPLPEWAGPFVILLPLWLVGNAIRNWKLRVDALTDRAARLEREQEALMREAVAEERARIARELHDVVAHSVSVMVVQAGAARHVLPTSPDRAREALLAVEACGREAMAELRRLLGVLGEDGADVALAPQPGVEQLESLVQRVCEAGLPVGLRTLGQPRPLTPSVNLAVYRIVQEALTNALKYADLAHTEVILDYRDSELKIEILDDGTGSRAREGGEAGHGLVGMRERVAVYGGRLEAGPRLERGYAVRAWLPLEHAEL